MNLEIRISIEYYKLTKSKYTIYHLSYPNEDYRFDFIKKESFLKEDTFKFLGKFKEDHYKFGDLINLTTLTFDHRMQKDLRSIINYVYKKCKDENIDRVKNAAVMDGETDSSVLEAVLKAIKELDKLLNEIQN